uniref:RING-type E3 ubiquitin transferase n=1 Tax=Prasinoderma singulare TaxID=676789 RepID=A0A7S3BML5_9VIRI
MKVWTRLVMLGLDAPQLLGGAQWRARLEAVRRDGVANLRPVFVLSSVIAPLVLSLLTALAAPYVGGKLVGGIVGAYSGAPDARTCERYAWAASGACVLTYAGFKRALAFLEGLHDSIRDEVYLTGQRLHNHGEQRPDEGRTARAAPAVAQSGATEPAGDSEEDGALTPRYRTRLQTRP